MTTKRKAEKVLVGAMREGEKSRRRERSPADMVSHATGPVALSKRAAIDVARAALATARKAAAVDDERQAKASDSIATKLYKLYLSACKAAKVDATMTFVVGPDGATRRGGGLGGDKSPSLGRQAKVTGWVVGGRDIGSPMASKLIAAVYNVERAKDVYAKDSPERFIRKSAFLAKLAGRKVKVLRDGAKPADAITFLKV